MRKTEKQFWVNGYQERERGRHKTLAMQINNLGIMIVFHTLHKIPKFFIHFYKLI